MEVERVEINGILIHEIKNKLYSTAISIGEINFSHSQNVEINKLNEEVGHLVSLANNILIINQLELVNSNCIVNLTIFMTCVYLLRKNIMLMRG